MINKIMNELDKQLDKVFTPFLNPPATIDEIRNAENVMNTILPDDLRELYQIHNGEKETGPGLFFGLRFLPLNELLQEWKTWEDLEEEFALEGDSYSIPTGFIKERYINRYWIPISKDYGGNNIGIDLDPDDNGRKGQIINFGRDEEMKYVIAYQLTDFLQFIKDTLVTGNFTVHNEEDYTYWSYGRGQNIHFLDAIRSMDLPVLQPIKTTIHEDDMKEWLEQLNDQWKLRIDSNPMEFIKKKKLYFISEGLEDITPLSICSDIRELILSGNLITDLAPLRDMQSLKKLYLVSNPIKDLSPISNLKNLQQLNISRTKVNDLTQLATIPSLKELEMLETDINDYSPLQLCKSLESLSLPITDRHQLEAISKIRSLKHLHIHDMHISEEDLLLLSNIKNLEILELENSELSSLDCFSKSQSLREINLKNTILKDGSVLGKLPCLKKIELNGSTIDNLEVIAQSSSLKTFQGSFRQFDRLKDLFDRKIDFSTIIGGMTDEESELWHQYLDAN